MIHLMHNCTTILHDINRCNHLGVVLLYYAYFIVEAIYGGQDDEK
jgi:hypothetical protein